MAKIPLSAKKEIPRKCPLCDKKFKSKEYLVSHIEKVHGDQIPNEWSSSRYENYLRTNKDHGVCIVCGKETKWNESTWKYNRLCDDKKCRNELAKKAKKNMISKYGKVHLLNDADMQRKMIYAKHTSGVYIWSTDDKKEFPQHYASKPEKSFLEMLDSFLNLEPSDIESPSPHTYVYTYEGKEHQYIPDHYIRSLNLEVEIKEPSDNQNMHPKIQAVDKVKENLKDEMMNSIDEINYIKINGTDYRKFFTMFSILKNVDDINSPVVGSVSEGKKTTVKVRYKDIIPKENFISDYDRVVNKISDVKNAIELSFNPKQGFKSILDKLEKRLYKIDTIRDCLDVRSYCIALRNRLNTFIISENGDHRLKYEAQKAIKRIDDYILYQLDIKMESLKRHGVTEDYNYDVKKGGKRYKPIFIVLTYGGSLLNKIIKFGTKQQWSHASIALDTELHNNITFGDKVHDNSTNRLLGFKFNEDTRATYKKAGAKYAVYMYLATPHEYDTIREVIDEFRRDMNIYKFDIPGLLKVWRQKGSDCIDTFVCSTFVAYVLGEANPRLLSKHYSLYSPGDLSEIRNFELINSGLVCDYNPEMIDTITKEKLKQLGCNNIKSDDDPSLDDDIYYPSTEATYITCTKNEEEYYPVFIVLNMGMNKFSQISAIMSGSRAAHASIALDTSLTKNITFSSRSDDERLLKSSKQKYGFTYDEDMFKAHTNPKSSYVIYMYMAHIREYAVLQEVIKDFKSRKNVGKYSIRNIVNLLNGRETVNTENFICSTFVAYVLNEMNPTLLNKHYSLMTPADFTKVKQLIKVEDGLIKYFDEEEFDNRVTKILTQRGFENVQLRYKDNDEPDSSLTDL